MGMEEESTAEQAQARPMLHLGETAPDFEALTTHGPMKLSDYKGGWVILFSHPADFTPVCTTEFMGFAKMHPELEKRGVGLIGLSVDSVHSHIAWVRNIEEKMGVAIPFPVIADLNMNVGTLYGMIHPGQSATAAVRSSTGSQHLPTGDLEIRRLCRHLQRRKRQRSVFLRAMTAKTGISVRKRYKTKEVRFYG
jgi:peroxiredoxin